MSGDEVVLTEDVLMETESEIRPAQVARVDENLAPCSRR